MIDALYIATVGDLDRLDLWVRAWGFHHHIHLYYSETSVPNQGHDPSHQSDGRHFHPKSTLSSIGSYLRSAPTKPAISSTNCRSEWSMLCKFLSVTGCTAYEKTGVIALPTKKMHFYGKSNRIAMHLLCLMFDPSKQFVVITRGQVSHWKSPSVLLVTLLV